MKVLVLATDYPNPQGNKNLMYIHMRDIYYMECGLDVTVLNFKSSVDYTQDGIRVISLNTYKKSDTRYDVLVSHASNIRNHYVFLKRFGKRFSKIIFVYHGHEVLPLSEYPKPYSYMPRANAVMAGLQRVYDHFKLFVWRKYIPRVIERSRLIFVSEWMKEQFFRWTRIDPAMVEKHSTVIYNAIGQSFEKASYKADSEKQYDCITIRSNLDGSKYGIDIVNEIAKNNSELRFLVVGKGKYFKHFQKADNVEWISNTLSHEEMLKYLNLSRCALMPTRYDAQGLMACELAGYGMPLITSDIPVCSEIFSGMRNVAYISNTDLNTDLSVIISRLESFSYQPDERFFGRNTVMKEVELIKSISNDVSDCKKVEEAQEKIGVG